MKITMKFRLLLTLTGIFGVHPFDSTFAKDEGNTKLSEKSAFDDVYKKLDAQVRAALKGDQDK